MDQYLKAGEDDALHELALENQIEDQHGDQHQHRSRTTRLNCCHRGRANSTTPTGSVRDLSLSVTMSGQRKSFQIQMKWKMASAASAGLHNGRMS